MTRIFLTRHGHVEGIEPPQFRGRTDLPLTEKGCVQARSLAAALAEREKPAAIYTSPLSRCVETGGIIAGALDMAPQVLEGLIDLDYGDWTGIAHTDVQKADAARFALWWEAPQFVRPPGGESLQDICARMGNVIRHVLSHHAGDSVVLVGHDSGNRAALLTLLDLPLSAYWRLVQSPCAISEIEVIGARTLVRSMNETGHLGHYKTGAP